MKTLQAKPVLKVGEITGGRVSKIEQFGAFVELGNTAAG
jgi:predicted RNA-binding protein with RPS1 domain